MAGTAGTLFLCATPIGNLEDMTFRAVRMLKEVNMIAAEDTRHTRKLLSYYDIHTPLVSYHEHNKDQRGPELVEMLLNGNDIAVVSDAGLPGVSDPGSHLVALAIKAGIAVSPLPGANAALSALICSGLDTTQFLFVGFLPKTVKKRREALDALESYSETLLFYETPHRLKATLAELRQVFGDRQAAAARELTKKFEQFIRGNLDDLIAYFNEHEPRGEFVLVTAGKQSGECADKPRKATLTTPVEAVLTLVAAGMNKKDAIRTVAKERGLSRRDVYQAVLACEEK